MTHFVQSSDNKDVTATTTAPTLTGTTNILTKPQGSSYHALVALHALLLGIAFVVVLPVEAVILRFSFSLAVTTHWLLQVFATIACFVGLALAIALSIDGVQYSDFDRTHQILGLVVVGLLVCQVAAGYWHHVNFKRLRRRTCASYIHFGLARLLIYGGMINAVL